MTQEEFLTSSRIFNTKVEEILSRKLVQRINEGKVTLRIEGGKGKPTRSIWVGPLKEDLDSIVNTLRMFLTHEERVSFGSLGKHYNSEWAPEYFRTGFNDATKQLRQYLGNKSRIQNYTHEKLLFMYFHGEIMHTDIEKREEYEKLTNNAIIGSFLHSELIGIVSRIIHVAIYVRERNIALAETIV